MAEPFSLEPTEDFSSFRGDIRRRKKQVNMFGDYNPGQLFNTAMDRVNTGYNEIRAGSNERFGQETLARDQQLRRQALDNWMAAQGVRRAQGEEAFYGSPGAQEFFHHMFPGQPGTPAFGQEPIYERGFQSGQAQQRAALDQADAVARGATTFFHPPAQPGQPAPVQSPQEQAYWRILGIPMTGSGTNAPGTTPAAAPAPTQAQVPFGGVRAFGESAAPTAAFAAGAKTASRFIPTAMQKMLPALSKVPRVGKALAGAGALAAGLGAGSLTEGAVETLDPQAGAARAQHPILSGIGGLLGLLTPGFMQNTPTPEAAARVFKEPGGLGERSVGMGGVGERGVDASRLTPEPVGANPARPSMSNVPGASMERMVQQPQAQVNPVAAQMQQQLQQNLIQAGFPPEMLANMSLQDMVALQRRFGMGQ